MATLNYINDSGEEDLVHVGEGRSEVTIGRHRECELRTRNNTVSRRHSRVSYQDGNYVLDDLESANGTFFHRERISRVDLEDGETIYCGTFQVTFRLDETDQARVAAMEPEPPPVPEESGQETLLPYEPEEVPDTVEAEPAPAAAPVSEMEQTLGYEAPSGSNPPIALKEPPSDDEEVVSFTDDPALAATACQGTDDEPLPPRPEETTDVVSEMVNIGETSTPDAARLLEQEDARSSREADLVSRVEELEQTLGERDRTIRQLALQVEELGNLVSRYEAEQAPEGGEDVEIKIADLERVVASVEAEKAAHEQTIEDLRAQVEDKGARALELDGQVAELTLKVEDLLKNQTDADELEKARTELEGSRARISSLDGEMKGAWTRVEDLEGELAAAVKSAEAARGETETLRGKVAELTAAATSAQGAGEKADQLATELGTLSQELTDVKAANRSYLKKISRQLKDIETAVKAVDGLNEIISSSRTSLDILVGLLPEVAEHMDGSDDGSDAMDQVRTAAEELTQTVRNLKHEILATRKRLKE